jgi:AbiV family abortive infection protein
MSEDTQVENERTRLHAAATAILANALRLYRDAVLLLKEERHASCLSVSVLAAEELAKFLSLVELQSLNRSEWRLHHAKHVGTASFLLRRKFQAALSAALEGRPEKADHVRFAQLDFREDDEDEMALFDEVLQNVGKDGSLGHFSRAHQKEMDIRKQRGFYVDLKGDLTIKSDPQTITREEASDQLEFFRATLQVLSETMKDKTETVP